MQAVAKHLSHECLSATRIASDDEASNNSNDDDHQSSSNETNSQHAISSDDDDVMGDSDGDFSPATSIKQLARKCRSRLKRDAAKKSNCEPLPVPSAVFSAPASRTSAAGIRRSSRQRSKPNIYSPSTSSAMSRAVSPEETDTSSRRRSRRTQRSLSRRNSRESVFPEEDDVIDPEEEEEAANEDAGEDEETDVKATDEEVKDVQRTPSPEARHVGRVTRSAWKKSIEKTSSKKEVKESKAKKSSKSTPRSKARTPSRSKKSSSSKSRKRSKPEEVVQQDSILDTSMPDLKAAQESSDVTPSKVPFNSPPKIENMAESDRHTVDDAVEAPPGEKNMNPEAAPEIIPEKPAVECESMDIAKDCVDGDDSVTDDAVNCQTKYSKRDCDNLKDRNVLSDSIDADAQDSQLSNDNDGDGESYSFVQRSGLQLLSDIAADNTKSPDNSHTTESTDNQCNTDKHSGASQPCSIPTDDKSPHEVMQTDESKDEAKTLVTTEEGTSVQVSTPLE